MEIVKQYSDAVISLARQIAVSDNPNSLQETLRTEIKHLDTALYIKSCKNTLRVLYAEYTTLKGRDLEQASLKLDLYIKLKAECDRLMDELKDNACVDASIKNPTH